MATIPLPGGKAAIVDDSDMALVNDFPWHVSHNGYVIRRERYGPKKKRKRITYLHRVLMGVHADGLDVDHVDGDKLNNRRSTNLRWATRSQNMGNQRARNGCSSRFKGVAWDKGYGRWWAYINKDGQRVHIGYFDDEVDAARAYNEASSRLFGAYARLNTIDGPSMNDAQAML